ncbi:MAG TPA: NADH-quinone oxidoreductase subunit J [Saprospiraceae bacterium]|jgi:NADH-quinone oxidoreductase subunit J|nr:NADH-quinone oxidoreductase subunit J [Saprospiraceae bacterium]HOJ91694.1 NADH-quinone oxidoreductase subunit J [Saprospiraceae bacterium]HUN15647.1 NADH-quinone oxidoreductase subunit J [Saprospiraceae bacterium]
MNIDYIFYLLTALTIICATMVVVSKHPIRSVLFLVATFFCISAHYILLNAQFLALVNIVVYAGAIMVLFLFVIMFLNLNKEVERNKSILYWLGAIVSAGCIFLMLVSSVGKVALTNGNIEKENYTLGLVENIGMSLYTDYLFPMEICSVLFLVAMIGVVLLSRKENKFTTNTVSNV